MKNTKTKINNFKQKINLNIATFVLFGLTLFPANVFASEITTENIAYLINKERVYFGLSPLKISSELSAAANLKSSHMIELNYFDHYAYGLAPWDFMKYSGYDYRFAGENLAMDFETAEGMVNAWMNSDTHRKNILNEKYNEMGIGVVKGVYSEDGEDRESYIVTNMFGRRKNEVAKNFANLLETVLNVFSRK